MGLVIAGLRRVVAGDRYVRAGRWLQAPFPLGVALKGKTLGIVGLGRIGKAIAKRAAAFDMDISYFGRHKQNDVTYKFYDKLVDMAASVDFMVVICPGGAETKGIVNAEVIKALGKKGALINVARGSVVDEVALVKALKDGTLGAAGLDVFADEPKVPEELFTMENVTLLPHLGSATHETRKAMADLVVANLRAHLKGEKLPTRYA